MEISFPEAEKNAAFVKSILKLALFEAKKEPSAVLVSGEGRLADAIFSSAEKRFALVRRAPGQSERFDLIFLLGEMDAEELGACAAQDALVVDIGVGQGVRTFDPALPYRRMRLLSLEGEESLSLFA